MVTDAETLQTNEEAHAAEDAGMAAEDIDLDFVPVPRTSVVSRDFDGEVVLLEPESGALHVLNPTSAIVWQCFDGEVALGELAGELSEAFGASLDVVQDDVLTLAQLLGRAGLLLGVAAADPRSGDDPAGLEIGAELTPFRLPALGGGEIDLAALRGRRVLLVNWSPSCTFCEAAAEELAPLTPALAEAGVDLVLLSFDEPDDNAQMLAEHGLTAKVALQYDDDDESDEAEAYEHPFPEMGTPVAYLLDEEGKVAEPLANGGFEVPRLARKAAGISERRILRPVQPEADAERSSGADTQYVTMPAAAGVCAPSSGGGGAKRGAPKTWENPGAYRIGKYHVGIRADSPQTDALLARALAAYRIEDDAVPTNYSVLLPGSGDGGARGLNLLTFGSQTLVRTRSPRRLLTALTNFLLPYEERPLEPGLYPVSASPAIWNGRAILLPTDAITTWLEEIQPRLAKAGISLVDVPRATIDFDTAELVVPEPAVTIAPGVLAELGDEAPRRSEGTVTPPGRYPLAVWTLWQPGMYHEVVRVAKDEEGLETVEIEGEFEQLEQLSRAMAAADTLWLVAEREGETAADHLERLAELFKRVPAVAVFGFSGDDFVKNLVIQLEQATTKEAAAS